MNRTCARERVEGFMFKAALFGAALALGPSASHAQAEGGPTLRIPKSWLAQANGRR